MLRIWQIKFFQFLNTKVCTTNWPQTALVMLTLATGSARPVNVLIFIIRYYEFKILYMSSICFYFQVHQPLRIKKYRYFDIGTKSAYFDDDSDSNLNNKRIIHKVAGKSYLPTNKLLLELIKLHPEFKVSFSLSGLAIEQFERFSPETLESFQRLVDTGRV